MVNNLNLTKETKETMRALKGKLFKSYIENSNDGFSSIVRFVVEKKAFDLKNEYTAYKYPDGESAELTCLTWTETDNNSSLKAHAVGEKIKETSVLEEILNVYIVKDEERGSLIDSGIPYDLVFDTALIIQTKSHCFAFWRQLIFNTIESVVCDSLSEVLTKIKSESELQEEAQEENPYTVTVKRSIEEL